MELTEMPQLAAVASLIGEPARLKILWSLLDGRAYTATELSLFAGISVQNASIHLGKLVQAGLLKAERQGRHRYYTFAREQVAFAVEALAGLAPPAAPKKTAGQPIAPIRYCRSCYDHLAGHAGVLITARFTALKYLREKDGRYELTRKGREWFSFLDIAALEKQQRVFARPCLDWSERKYHLAGALGAAWLQYMLQHDWLRRNPHSRVLTLTGLGRKCIYEQLGVDVGK